ncbi:DUF3471 domain-containing protein [Spirosoma pomorum]
MTLTFHFLVSFTLASLVQRVPEPTIVFGVTDKAFSQVVSSSTSDTTLQRYVGAYEVAPGQQLSISLSNDTLYVLPPGETAKSALKLVTDDEFIVVGEEARLFFKRNTAGQILAVEVRFGNGASVTGKKV